MYVRNAWYAALWSQELPAGQMIARTLLDEPVVFLRTTPAAPRPCSTAVPIASFP